MVESRPVQLDGGVPFISNATWGVIGACQADLTRNRGALSRLMVALLVVATSGGRPFGGQIGSRAGI